MLKPDTLREQTLLGQIYVHGPFEHPSYIITVGTYGIWKTFHGMYTEQKSFE